VFRHTTELVRAAVRGNPQGPTEEVNI